MVISVDNALTFQCNTFVSDVWHTTSWLDHRICPKNVSPQIYDCWIIYDSFKSDHLPLAISIHININNAALKANKAKAKAKPSSMQ